MLDYTKYRLKPDQEILDILKDKTSIFLVSCKKCFREFTHEDGETEECYILPKFLKDNNKKFTGCVDLDFLCNSHHNAKILKDIDFKGAEAVGVLSCGLGIALAAQTIEKLPVYAIADTIPQANNNTCETAYHGIALTAQKCAACAQCYLNVTGGICPIVDCSKSLLNGQCGGAKNGKCEVKGKDNSTKDCAWEKIYNRLSVQKSPDNNTAINIRNYAKPAVEFINKLSNANLEKRNQGFYGGLHPFENKDTTNEKPISSFPEPETVSILLSQHTGAICEPLVKSGDTVQFGQKIGDSNSFISAPVHSSVSGKVISIEEALHPAIQKKVKAVIIKNDFKNTQHESVKPAVNIEALSKEELVNIIREKGIVGLGGAMFPTHVKLKPPKPVDTLLINGCECEPYLTADNRVMIEHAREVISGIQILEKILGTKQTLIAIEDNKPQAVEAMKTQTGSSITVSTLPSKYPQGAEKVLIKKTLGRDVPAGKIPLDVGVVVTNVSTALSVYDAVYKGTPLIERIITISGKNCSKPGNYKVKLGTPLQNILKHCFDKPADTNTEIKMGGPMMGILQPSIETSIIKGTTGIITVDKKVVEPDTQRSCIKCGRCVDACPMELYPLFYAYCSSKNKLEDNEKYDVAACIECGSCENICSSKIALTSIIKQSKRIIASKKVS